MKRIFLLAVLFAGSFTVSLAQSVAPKPAVAEPVSKTEFVALVSQLDNLINAGKKDEAEKQFDAINKMAIAEFKVMHYKVRDEADASKKQQLMKSTGEQRLLFADALHMRNEDMMGKRQAIVDKLNAFAETIQ